MKRMMLIGFVVAIILIAAAQASGFFWEEPPTWAPWLFMVGTTMSLVTIMGVGASRRGHLGRMRWILGGVFLILIVGFGVALALPPADPADPTLWLGLPPRAAVILYGVGLLPFLAVPVSYALTFDRNTLREEDWERVREAAVRYRDEIRGTEVER